jgi:hypothetical protein
MAQIGMYGSEFCALSYKLNLRHKFCILWHIFGFKLMYCYALLLIPLSLSVTSERPGALKKVRCHLIFDSSHEIELRCVPKLPLQVPQLLVHCVVLHLQVPHLRRHPRYFCVSVYSADPIATMGPTTAPSSAITLRRASSVITQGGKN